MISKDYLSILLLNVCVLFERCPDVLAFYQDKFRYILVDEYQDTNGVQYQLVQLLARRYQNLCVVGDDDQSIYGWRGADIRNILDFERDFNGAKVIKLEQNYRSTQNILNAANEVVSHNQGRKAKKLWTDNEKGDVITILEMDNEYKEAIAIAEMIRRGVAGGERNYKEYAILYRTNAQSRVLEEKMMHYDIPYRLLGGTRFYERKEIKDLIAYLRAVANLKDDISIKRIINVPKRGIGAASVETISKYAIQQNLDFYEAARYAKEFGVLGNAPGTKVLSFIYLLEGFRATADNGDVKALLEKIIEDIDYINHLRQTEGEDAADRIENIKELVSKAATYMQNAEEPSLEKFLEEIALVADIDNYDEQSNSVVLMTLHSAKGLEFPVVFIPGLEEGMFPSYMSMTDGEEKVEEERRLCYVGITRAREKLYMFYTQERTIFGRRQASLPSRFLKELPIEVTNQAKFERGTPTSRYTSNATTSGTGMTLKTKDAKSTMSIPTMGSSSGGTMKLNTAYTNPLSPFSKNKMTSASNAPKGFSKIENLPKVEETFYAGDIIKHKLFGEGTITDVDETEEDVFVTITFKSGVSKKLSVRFAKLSKL